MAQFAGGTRSTRGDKGERGDAAQAIARWEVSAQKFAVVPYLESGVAGPAVHLRSLFEEFVAQTTAGDDAMDDPTFERIMAERRALKRKLDAIVIPAEPPATWEEIEALCAQHRELLDISARIDVLEAEFERGCVRVVQ